MKYINYEIQERVAYITINRPEKRNALNDQVIAELITSFKKAESDTLVKVIILKAEGEVFCAGADLDYLQKLQKNSFEENLEDSKNLMELFHLIHTLKKVVIAQVNGHAIAGGCGLVSVCDFAYSSVDANFGYSEVRIGFIPSIVMVFLLRKIGETHAKELLLAGNVISALDAKNYGLINWVVEEPEELEQTVFEFAQRLCLHNSEKSMEITKKMISGIQTMKLEDALNYATKMNAEARSTDDCKKGIAAFLEKKKLEW